MAVDLNQIFAGIGQRASQAVMPWAQFAGSGQQSDPFASLGQSNAGGFDPWSAFGASKSGGSDPFASLTGGRSAGGNDVWQALSMISGAKNKITPTPNTQAWTANTTNGYDPNAFTPDQQQWYAKAKAVAQAHGVDPDIFARQMFQESKFDTNAQSGAGAKGIAQFTDPTAKQYGITNPFDGDQSLDAGARYMSDLLHQYGGDYQKALIAYNGGGRAVQAWQSGSPFDESTRYVTSILAPQQQPAGTAAAGAGMDSGIMQRVQPFLGDAYVWGGKTPQSGFDCSGLAGWLTTGQAESTKTLYTKSQAVDPSTAQPGDLVFYNMQGGANPSMDNQHVAVYIGNGQIVQAGGTKHNVNIAQANQFTAPGWQPEFRRISTA